MALKKYKPTTPGQRFKIISAFDDITTNKPEKSLIVGKTIDSLMKLELPSGVEVEIKV